MVQTVGQREKVLSTRSVPIGLGRNLEGKCAVANVGILQSSGFPAYATFTALKRVNATYAWHDTRFIGTSKEDKSGSEVAVSRIRKPGSNAQREISVAQEVKLVLQTKAKSSVHTMSVWEIAAMQCSLSSVMGQRLHIVHSTSLIPTSR